MQMRIPAMQKTKAKWTLGLLLMAALLPLEISLASDTGFSNAGMNFRSAPNGRKIGGIQKGERFTILEKRSGWIRIQKANGSQGWVWDKYIEVESPNRATSSSASTPTHGQLQGIRSSLNVRQQPSSRSRQVGSLKPNQNFEILGKASNGWYKVRTADGAVGYASDNFIRLVETPKPVDEITTGAVAPAAAREVTAEAQDNEEAVDDAADAEIFEKVETEDTAIEAECRDCDLKAKEVVGTTRDVFEIPEKILEFHNKEFAQTNPPTNKKIVPIIANGCSIGSRFGMRKHPILGYKRMHSGQDVRTGGKALDLRSPTAGVVQRVYSSRGSGNTIEIKLENGYTVVYMHMRNKSPMKNGQKISAGAVVGKVGSTGLSTGPHLHLEVKNSKGQKIDPLSVFKRNEVCGNA